MTLLKQTIMRRDGLSSEEADNAIDEARAELNDLLSQGDIETAYNICEEYFSLEPDYLIDLM